MNELTHSLQLRFKKFLISLFILFIGFNIWHISKHGLWEPPSFIHSLTLTPLIASVFSKIDPAIVNDGGGGNDGQFFYILSYDPLLKAKKYLYLLDFPRYRYNRVIYPLLTHIISLGNPTLYPYILMFIGWFAYIAGAIIINKLCIQQHWTKWVIAGYLTNTGIVYSAFRDMSEPLATTFILIGIWFWSSKKKKFAIPFFAAAILTKEIYLIPPLAIYVWEWHVGNISFKKLVQATIFTVLPYLIWIKYVALQIPYGNAYATVGMAHHTFGVGRFSLPFIAMTQEMWWGLKIATTRHVFKLTASIYIVTTTCVLLGLIAFWRRPTLWTALLVFEGLFITSVRGEIWNYYASSCRQSSFLYLLFYFWLADELKDIKIPLKMLISG